MKIGYPCINLSLSCSSAKTFRLASYSEERLRLTIENNLTCLQLILNFNAKNDILFFRITSDLIPFASHPVNKFPWQRTYRNEFEKIGKFITHNNMRVSLHPDQFTLINSVDPKIFRKSVDELNYHVAILELLGVDQSNKIQIHVGGVYKDKITSLNRFIKRFETLPLQIKERLVVENDERLYNVSDCLMINRDVGIPIVLDVFHHVINNNQESIRQALLMCSTTWNKKDGLPIVDYSTQEHGKPKGSHAQTVDLDDFRKFMEEMEGIDFDLMVEIKDKENSILKILRLLKEK